MRTEDKLAQTTKERPTDRVPLRMTRTRRWLFGSTLAVYVATVVCVLTNSWLVRLDWQVMFFRPYKQWPEIHAFLDYFVVLGQRGPTAVMVAAWLGWRAYQQRTLHPLLVLGTALLLLNVTVGSAKLGMGRLGPHYATVVNSNEMWLGGDIFPSGHTANAVVTWGVLAYLASTPGVRRFASVMAALLAYGVGMTTVYLGTHWVSDVFLGWAAGLLVLLALPWFEPLMARAEARILATRSRLRTRLAATAPAPAAARPGLVAQRLLADDGLAVREAGAACRSGTPGSPTRPAEARPHHPPRPHTTRHERTPVTPIGSRRPPVERPARPAAPLGQPRNRGVV